MPTFPSFFAALLTLVMSLTAFSATASTPTDILNQLEQIGYEIDRSSLERAAIQGMATALDPKARVLDIPARAKFQKMLNGESLREEHVDPHLSYDAPEEWPDKLCYVKLRGIYKDTKGLTRTLKKWESAGKSGIILDARKASGTNLQALDTLLDLFVKNGSPLYKVLSEGGQQVDLHKAKGTSGLSVPCILLVDQNTTGAAELLAAVLSHYNSTLLIGTRTSGDNRVREFLELDKKNSLYIATQRVVLANDTSYDVSGITPDIVVNPQSHDHRPTELHAEKAGAGVREEIQRDQKILARIGDDTTLRRATDILLGIRALGTPTSHDRPNASN